jgi:outer membrane protein TolC
VPVLALACLVLLHDRHAAAAGPPLLDLATAQRLSLRGDPTLAAAAERIGQAREAVERQRGAFWPELQTEKLGGPPLDLPAVGRRAIEPTPVEVQDRLRARLNAQWTLYDGLKRDFEAAAVRFGERQSRAAADEARRVLLAAVAERYLETQLAQEERIIFEEHLAALRRPLAPARDGRPGPPSEAHSRALLAAGEREAREAVQRAEERYADAMAILVVLTGPLESGSDPLPAVEPLAPETAREMTPPDPTGLMESAERLRPDLQEARYALQRIDATTGAARVDWTPDLKVKGTLEGDLRRDEPVSSLDELDGSLGLFMEIPIFEGGARRERLARLRSQRQAARSDLAALQREIQGQVLAAAAGVREAQSLLQGRLGKLERVRRNHRAVEPHVSPEGLARAAALDNEVTAARLELAQARAGLHRSWTRVAGVTGRVLEGWGG